MKKILILGIGNAQVDPIKLLKEKGYEVHTCSYTSNGRGKEFGDQFALINITDFDAVLEYVKSNDIDIVYSTGSDLAMPTASYVSEKLKLPHFISTETSKLCNTKQELRRFIGDEVYNVMFQEIESKTCEIQLEYPFIMKPVDSQGQRGIKLINSKAEFENHFEVALSHSRSKKIIIEEFIEGPEISANVYMLDGEVVFSLISDRISWPQFEGGIIHKHIIPSKVIDKDSEKSVNDMIKSVTKKLNINNGPAYFQIKIQNNKPKLIEVTPRLDGCHMWRLIKESTGVDLLNITMSHLIENNIDKKHFSINEIDKQYILEFICKEPNSIVEGTEFNIENTLHLEEYYKKGEKVKPMNGYMEKIGYYITSRRGE